MSRRLNRYTGEDEEVNRLLRSLRRERRRSWCLGLALVVMLGYTVFQLLPDLPMTWQVADDRFCVVVGFFSHNDSSGEH